MLKSSLISLYETQIRVKYYVESTEKKFLFYALKYIYYKYQRKKKKIDNDCIKSSL